MNEQKIVANRIEQLCRERKFSYYTLAYRSGVPLTTLMHIIGCTTKNPGLLTISKLCGGFGMALKDFFDSDEFVGMEYKIDE